MEVSVLSGTTSGFPRFQGTDDSFVLSESTAIGHQVTTVSATTQRGGTSLTYHIAGGNVDHAFMITPSGQIKTSKYLDHEKTDYYELWVEARDNGSPSLSDFFRIEITVSDENDNSPSFERNFYTASVTEEENAPVFVIAVSASDLDSGDNGRITYQLAAGNTGNAFTIDSATGQIQTNRKLNREEVEKYSLEVEAVDHVRVN